MGLGAIVAFWATWSDATVSVIRLMGEILMPALSALIFWLLATKVEDHLPKGKYIQTISRLALGLTFAIGGSTLTVWRVAELRSSMTTAQWLKDTSDWHSLASHTVLAGTCMMLVTLVVSIMLILSLVLIAMTGSLKGQIGRTTSD